MTAKRQLRLGAFMRPTTIHTAAWRFPGAWPDANFNFPRLKQLIRKLEAWLASLICEATTEGKDSKDWVLMPFGN